MDTNDFLRDEIVDDGLANIAWIGAYRIGPTKNEYNQFAFVDGSILDFEPPWYQYGKPDNFDEKEFCVFVKKINRRLVWNDYECWSQFNPFELVKDYICQKEIDSTSEQNDGGRILNVV